MTPFATRLSDEDMADLAAFYAAQKSVQRPARLIRRTCADDIEMLAQYAANLGGTQSTVDSGITQLSTIVDSCRDGSA